MTAAVVAHLADEPATYIFFVVAPLVALLMVRLGSSREARKDADEQQRRADAGQQDVPRLPRPARDRPPGGEV